MRTWGDELEAIEKAKCQVEYGREMRVGDRMRCSVEGAAAGVSVGAVPNRRRGEVADVEGTRRVRVAAGSESRKEFRSASGSELRHPQQNVLYDVYAGGWRAGTEEARMGQGRLCSGEARRSGSEKPVRGSEFKWGTPKAKGWGAERWSDAAMSWRATWQTTRGTLGMPV